MKTPRWLHRDTLLVIHAAQIAEHGGKPGVRDGRALDSALSRGPELFAHNAGLLTDLAAAYAGGIMRKLPFVDGNKRSAFVAALVFLRLNGLRYTGTTNESVAMMLRFSKGRASESDVAVFFQNNSKRQP